MFGVPGVRASACAGAFARLTRFYISTFMRQVNRMKPTGGSDSDGSTSASGRVHWRTASMVCGP